MIGSNCYTNTEAKKRSNKNLVFFKGKRCTTFIHTEAGPEHKHDENSDKSKEHWQI